MKFVYIGPAKETTVFGATFGQGVPVEISDEYAVGKLLGHPLFKPVEVALVKEEKPMRGRPKGRKKTGQAG